MCWLVGSICADSQTEKQILAQQEQICAAAENARLSTKHQTSAQVFILYSWKKILVAMEATDFLYPQTFQVH